MKNSEIAKWRRIEYDGTAVYVLPEGPDWFVPSVAGDRLFQQTLQNGPGRDGRMIDRVKEAQFLSTLPPVGPEETYAGRKSCLSLDRLSEFWFHITDRCNRSCRHCLFSCGPGKGAELEYAGFRNVLKQVLALGTRTVYITGGEPLVHPKINHMLSDLFSLSGNVQVVMLTNGELILSQRDFFKSVPLERFYLQISVDGNEMAHDRLRGRGSYQRVMEALRIARAENIRTCLAMTVHPGNLDDMPDLIDIADAHDIGNVHYLWLFATGRAKEETAVSMDEVFFRLKRAYDLSRQKNIVIDNIEALKCQVFSIPGTKYDLSNAGWSSLAMGPDLAVYPTPALIGQQALCCGNAGSGIESVWKDSALLNRIRGQSLVDDAGTRTRPLKYLIGGGDMDHSFYAGNVLTGCDPYLDLYEKAALMLMAESAKVLPVSGRDAYPCVLARMGDRLESCEFSESGVHLTHSNCVLFVNNARQKVEQFYASAADHPEADQDILNPVCYPEAEVSHIPEFARVRSFGCGSPVMDADIREGETIVDLGSGTGVECFMAAKATGRNGRVIGIDMTDVMLNLAGRASGSVAKNLGFANTFFLKGFLEHIPLADSTVDVVVSNCVINLTADKAGVLSDVFRILKPGGRFVVSDVVTDSRPSAGILNDPVLRGECIAGAMLQQQLMALLEVIGFRDIRIIKRFFYREVKGHQFYSITYACFKPSSAEPGTVIYGGPFAAVMTDSGALLLRGHSRSIGIPGSLRDSGALHVLDSSGSISGMTLENSCACYIPPAADGNGPDLHRLNDHLPSEKNKKMRSGCMVCGTSLVYPDTPQQGQCHYCGRTLRMDAVCGKGHFVCDACHGSEVFDVVKHICLTSPERDMITLLNRIRQHPAMPVHGPEHHFVLPGVVLSAYRNCGGHVTDQDVITAINRGREVPGGTCAFWGTCGAVTGAGIALALIMKANPLKALERQIVQQAAASMIREISAVPAARCCQRESWTVLRMLPDLLDELFSIKVTATGDTQCRQVRLNKECAGKACPYFKKIQG